MNLSFLSSSETIPQIVTDFRNISVSLRLSNVTFSINLHSSLASFPSVEFGISQANYGLFGESSWEIQLTREGAVVGVAAIFFGKAIIAGGTLYGALRLATAGAR